MASGDPVNSIKDKKKPFMSFDSHPLVLLGDIRQLTQALRLILLI